MNLYSDQITEDQSPGGIDLYKSFEFVFSSKDWTVNLVIGFACFFLGQSISVAGLIFVLAYWGYTFQVVESRILFPGSIYPTFEFKRIGEYLHRSVWPFVATLPLWLAWSLQFVFWELMLIFPMIFLISPGQADETRAYVSLGIPSTILLLIVATCLVMMILIPMTLRAGLMRSFREAWRIRWIAGFVRRTWLEMSVAFLFIFSVSWMLALLGAAMGCVGLFVAQAWSMLALMHLSWQLYEIHLRKGGSAIVVYEPPTEIYGAFSAETGETPEDEDIGSFVENVPVAKLVEEKSESPSSDLLADAAEDSADDSSER